MMKATKHPEVSADPEFDRKEESFKTFDSLTTELDKEMSLFLGNFESLMEAQINIVKTIDSYYGDYDFKLGCDRSLATNQEKLGDRDGISLEYLKILEEIKEAIFPELLKPLQTTVMDPITDLLAYNEEIKQLIKKRGRKKFDFDVLKTKVDKLQKEVDNMDYEMRSKGTASTVKPQLTKQLARLDKLKNDFEHSKSIYEDLNGQLKSEVDQYLSLRFSLLDPTFESFIKIQLKLYGDVYNRLTSKELSIDASSREDEQNEAIDDRLDEILSKMKSLRLLNMAK